MELKDFISGTIKQITDGILEGNEYVKNKSKSLEGVRSQYTKVNFDVGITINEEHKDDFGGKISVVQVFSAGGSTSKNTSTSSQNRIQFDLLVMVKTADE